MSAYSTPNGSGKQPMRRSTRRSEIPQFIEGFSKSVAYPTIILDNRSRIIDTLRRLDSMIEMDSVKESFIAQIKLLLLLSSKSLKPSFHKMHAVFSGPPGVGKTTVAKMVADVWSKMGIIGSKDHCHSFSISESSDTHDIEYNHGNVERHDADHDQRMATSSADQTLDTENQIIITRGMSMCSKLTLISDSLCEAMKALDDLEVPDDQKKEIYDRCYKCNDVSRQLRDSMCPRMSDQLVDQCNTHDEELDFLGQMSRSSDSPPRGSSPGYVIVGREDFIAGFHGQTLKKTKRLLEKHRGKVIIIEEAYLLYTCKEDSFGLEALTMINRYMDEFPDDFIFIFIGYKDQLDSSIFAAQPGLRRRIQWNFKIDGYSPEGLAAIFKQQVENSGWTVENDRLVQFFTEHKEDFPCFGGDTERLVLHCQLAYAGMNFENSKSDLVIDRKVLKDAFARYMKCRDREDDSWRGMMS